MITSSSSAVRLRHPSRSDTSSRELLIEPPAILNLAGAGRTPDTYWVKEFLADPNHRGRIPGRALIDKDLAAKRGGYQRWNPAIQN
jgi:hypothetical protein